MKEVEEWEEKVLKYSNNKLQSERYHKRKRNGEDFEKEVRNSEGEKRVERVQHYSLGHQWKGLMLKYLVERERGDFYPPKCSLAICKKL